MAPDQLPVVQVYGLHNGKERIQPGCLVQLVTHLQKRLNLDLGGGSEEEIARYFHYSNAVKRSRFEIVMTNDTVIIDTPRPDETWTRCYLVKSGNRVHLQVTSGITKFDGSDSDKAEVDGIFPFRISGISLYGSSKDGDCLNFLALDTHGGVVVTETGRIRFQQLDHQDYNLRSFRSGL